MDDQFTVLQLSNITITAGFSGSSEPVISKSLDKPWYSSQLAHLDSLAETKNGIFAILKGIFRDELLVDVTSQRVVVLEDTLWSTTLKSIITEVIIHELHAKSLSFIDEPVCTTMGSGARDCLLVQLGWSESKVIPVYDLRALKGRYVLSTVRGFQNLKDEKLVFSVQSLITEIRDLSIKSSQKTLTSSDKSTDDIDPSTDLKPHRDVSWDQLLLDEDKYNDDEDSSVLQLVLKSLDMLDLDIRGAVLRNIVVVSDVPEIQLPTSLLRKFIDEVQKQYPKARLISTLGAFGGCSVYLSSVKEIKSGQTLTGEITRANKKT